MNESLARAIFVDFGYDQEIVFQSLRPLLEPMIKKKNFVYPLGVS